MRSGFIRIAQAAASALITVDIPLSSERLDRVAKDLVLSTTAAVILTCYRYEVTGVEREGTALARGTTETAILLGSIIPPGFYLPRTGRIAWRLTASVHVLVSILAMAASFSRFNPILLPPVLFVLYFLGMRERGGCGLLTSLAVLGTVGAFIFVPWDKTKERAKTITPYLAESIECSRGKAKMSDPGY